MFSDPRYFGGLLMTLSLAALNSAADSIFPNFDHHWPVFPSVTSFNSLRALSDSCINLTASFALLRIQPLRSVSLSGAFGSAASRDFAFSIAAALAADGSSFSSAAFSLTFASALRITMLSVAFISPKCLSITLLIGVPSEISLAISSSTLAICGSSRSDSDSRPFLASCPILAFRLSR